MASEHRAHEGPKADTSARGVSADPGMAVKMGSSSFAGIADLAAGRPCDETGLLALCDFVDARHDCADFRLVTILKVLCAWPDLLSPEALARLESTVLGFKYWMDEPGDDGMCFWSENHQAIFATCELIAGQLFPDRRFTNGGFTGRERSARGAERLGRWLGHRLRYGFTEWLSNTYYEEDVAPLALLVDHGEDPELVAAARTVLDLLMLDMAMHRFDGRFVASSGRAYAAQKQDPAKADVNDILARAFGPREREHAYDFSRLSATFVLGDYEVPAAIRAIADDPRPATVRVSHGLDVDEVVGEVGGPQEVETTGAFLWLMEAFVTTGSADLTARCMRAWRMSRNTFLRPLSWTMPLAGTGLAPWVVRVLNPAAQGIAIERADVVTTRTPHWLLSAAQRYRPRGFGDQQLLWTAALPGDITVFSTHPAAPLFEETARGFSPSAWVGNGINPDVVADENLLVVVHDLSPRRGFLERSRRQLSHLWFSSDRFDEVVRDERVVVGRAGDSLIGVVGSSAIEDGETNELVQSGRLTAWGVACSDVGESGGAQEFLAALVATRVVARPATTTWHVAGLSAAGGRRVVAVHRDGPALVDGRTVVTRHPRLDSPWGRAERFPDAIAVECDGQRWSTRA
ncbi:hypothetical protein [Mariniluteicoccus flavus]